MFTPGSPVLLGVFGKKADGIIYADLAFNDTMFTPAAVRLFAEFEKEYGKVNSSEHYAALSMVAMSALDKAIYSGQPVKDYLYANTFSDLIEGFRFDSKGDVVSGKIRYVLKTIKDGRPAPL